MAFGGLSFAYLLFCLLHFGQFVLAVTVCGLYGVELNRARQAGADADGKWVYAEIVGGLSAITSLLYFLPFILRFSLVWAWNLVLFILWIALFGVFGSMYIKENPEGNGDTQRMKNAVWVVLVNAILWLVATLGYFVYWWRHKERRSRFTSRAKV